METAKADIEVVWVDDEPTPDVHDGRPMRPEYAERGARFQTAYLQGRWT